MTGAQGAKNYCEIRREVYALVLFILNLPKPRSYGTGPGHLALKAAKIGQSIVF